MSMYNTIFVNADYDGYAAGEQFIDVNGAVRVFGQSAFASLEDAVASDASKEAVICAVQNGKYNYYKAGANGSLTRVSQVFYVNFDGGTGLVYSNGEYTINDITIEPAMYTAEQKQYVIQKLNAGAASDVVYVLEAPADGDYSTIYAGATDAFGNAKGISETIDVGNLNKNDNAFVNTDKVGSLDDLADTIEHESGHLTGDKHPNENGSINDFEANSLPTPTVVGNLVTYALGTSTLAYEQNITEESYKSKTIKFTDASGANYSYKGSVNGTLFQIDNVVGAAVTLNAKATAMLLNNAGTATGVLDAYGAKVSGTLTVVNSGTLNGGFNAGVIDITNNGTGTMNNVTLSSDTLMRIVNNSATAINGLILTAKTEAKLVKGATGSGFTNIKVNAAQFTVDGAAVSVTADSAVSGTIRIYNGASITATGTSTLFATSTGNILGYETTATGVPVSVINLNNFTGSYNRQTGFIKAINLTGTSTVNFGNTFYRVSEINIAAGNTANVAWYDDSMCGGDLYLRGYDAAGNGTRVKITGAGAINFNGASFSMGDGNDGQGLDVTGFTGTATIGAGKILTLDDAPEYFTSAATVALANGATLNLSLKTPLTGTETTTPFGAKLTSTAGQTATVNVNTNHTFGTAAQLDGYNGTINLAASKNLTLGGINSTNAKLTGVASTALIVNAAQTFKADGALTGFAGSITLGANSLTLEGNNTISGAITGTAASSIKIDSGAANSKTLTLTGANGGFVGSATVGQNDTLTLAGTTGADDSVKFGAASIALGTGAILNINTAQKLNAVITGAVSASTINVNANAIFAGASTAYAGVTNIADAKSLTLQAGFGAAGSVINFGAASILNLNAATAGVNASTLKMTGAAVNGIINVNENYTLNGDNTAFKGSVNIENGKTLTLTNGTTGYFTNAGVATLSLDTKTSASVNFAAVGTSNVAIKGAGNIIISEAVETLATDRVNLTGDLNSFNGKISFANGGDLNLANTSSTIPAINAATIDMATDTNANVLTLTTAQTINSTTISGGTNDNIIVGGTTTLAKDSVINTFDGTVDVNAALTLGSNTTKAIFKGASNINVASGKIFELDSNDAIKDFTGTMALGSASEIQLDGTNVTAAKFTGGTNTLIDANANQTFSGAGALNGFSGDLNLEANTITLSGANTTAATITGSGTVNFNENTTLEANNGDRFTGIANIASGKILTIDNAANTATFDAGTINLQGGTDIAKTQLVINDAQADMDAIFTGSANTVIDVNAATTLQTNANLKGFAGTINVDAALTLNGANYGADATAAKLTGASALNVNADQTLSSAGALNAYTGTAAIAAAKKIQLSGVNDTAAKFTGAVGTTIEATANQTFSANDAISGFNGLVDFNPAANVTVTLGGTNNTAATFSGEVGDKLNLTGATTTLSASGAISGFAGEIGVNANTLNVTNNNSTAATFTGTGVVNFGDATAATITNVLSGNNSAFAGTANIAAGDVVTLENDFGATGSKINFAAGATLNLNDASAGTNSSTLGMTGAATNGIINVEQDYTLAGDNTAFKGAVNITDGKTLKLTNGSTGYFTDGSGNATLSLDTKTSATVEFAAVGTTDVDVKGAGNILVSENATGAVKFTGDLNGFSGDIKFANGGDIEMANTVTTGTAKLGATDIIMGGAGTGANVFTNSTAQTIGGKFTGDADDEIVVNANTVLTADNSGFIGKATINAGNALTLQGNFGASEIDMITSTTGSTLNLDKDGLAFGDAVAIKGDANDEINVQQSATINGANQTAGADNFKGTVNIVDGKALTLNGGFDAGIINIGTGAGTTGGTLNLNTGSNNDLSATLTGDSANDKINVNGDATLSGTNNAYKGAVNVNGSKLSLTNGSTGYFDVETDIKLNTDMTNHAVLSFLASGAYAGLVSGNVDQIIEVGNNANLILSNANKASGADKFAGTIKVVHGSSLEITGGFDAGTIDLDSTDPSAGAGATLKLNTANGEFDATIKGGVKDSILVQKATTLNADNGTNYGGDVTVSTDAVLNIGAAGTTTASFDAASIALGTNGILNINGKANSMAAIFTGATASAINVNVATDLTSAGNLKGFAGTINVNAALTLTGANYDTAATAVKFTNNKALNVYANQTLSADGALDSYSGRITINNGTSDVVLALTGENTTAATFGSSSAAKATLDLTQAGKTTFTGSNVFGSMGGSNYSQSEILLGDSTIVFEKSNQLRYVMLKGSANSVLTVGTLTGPANQTVDTFLSHDSSQFFGTVNFANGGNFTIQGYAGKFMASNIDMKSDAKANKFTMNQGYGSQDVVAKITGNAYVDGVTELDIISIAGTGGSLVYAATIAGDINEFYGDIVFSGGARLILAQTNAGAAVNAGLIDMKTDTSVDSSGKGNVITITIGQTINSTITGGTEDIINVNASSTLTGTNNDYSGAVNVNGAALTLTNGTDGYFNGSTIINLAKVTTNNASVNFNDTGIYAGQIKGDADQTVNIAADKTVTFSNANQTTGTDNFSGTVNVADGSELIITNAFDAGTFDLDTVSPDTAPGATLTFKNTAGTYGALIKGQADDVVNVQAETTLTADNRDAGGNALFAGTVVIGDGDTNGSILNIGAAGDTTAVFDAKEIQFTTKNAHSATSTLNINGAGGTINAQFKNVGSLQFYPSSIYVNVNADVVLTANNGNFMGITTIAANKSLTLLDNYGVHGPNRSQLKFNSGSELHLADISDGKITGIDFISVNTAANDGAIYIQENYIIETDTGSFYGVVYLDETTTDSAVVSTLTLGRTDWKNSYFTNATIYMDGSDRANLNSGGTLNFAGYKSADNQQVYQNTAATIIGENGTINVGVSDATVNTVGFSGDNSAYFGSVNVYANDILNLLNANSYFNGVSAVTAGKVAEITANGTVNFTVSGDSQATLKGAGAYNFGTNNAATSIETINLSGDNSAFTGTATVFAGDVLNLTAANSYFNAATLAVAGTANFLVTGSTNVELTGAGEINVGDAADATKQTVTFGGDNSAFAGTANIIDGDAMRLTSDFGTAASTINVGDASRLELADDSTGASVSTITGGTTSIISVEKNYTLSGNNSAYNGKVYLDGGNLTLNNGTNGYFNGNTLIDMDGEAGTSTSILNFNDTGIYAGQIKGDADQNVNIATGKTVTFSNANQSAGADLYSGTVKIADGGTLNITNAFDAGKFDLDNTDTTDGNGATLNFNTVAGTYGATFAGEANDTINVNANTILTGESAGYAGTTNIADATSLTLKAGFGAASSVINFGTGSTLNLDDASNGVSISTLQMTGTKTGAKINVIQDYTLSGTNYDFNGTVDITDGKTLTLTNGTEGYFTTAAGVAVVTLDTKTSASVIFASTGVTDIDIKGEGTIQAGLASGTANQTVTFTGALNEFTGALNFVNGADVNLKNDVTSGAIGAATIDMATDAAENILTVQSSQTIAGQIKGGAEDELIIDATTVTLTADNDTFKGDAAIKDGNKLILNYSAVPTTVDDVTFDAANIALGKGATLDISNDQTLKAIFTGNALSGTDAASIIDVNADTKMTGAGALNAFNGEIQLEENSLTLTNNNNTAATLTGADGSDLVVDGGDTAIEVTLSGANAAFIGTATVGTADTLTLKGGFGAKTIDLVTADGGSASKLNFSNTTEATYQAEILGSTADIINVNNSAILDAHSDKTSISGFAGAINIATDQKLTLRDLNVTAAIFDGAAGTTLDIATAGLTVTADGSFDGFSGGITLGAQTLTIKGTTTTAATITGTGALNVITNTVGTPITVTLTGDNSAFTGTTSVNTGDKLILEGSFGASSITLGDGSVLDFDKASETFASEIKMDNAASNATINVLASNVTLSGTNNTFKNLVNVVNAASLNLTNAATGYFNADTTIDVAGVVNFVSLDGTQALAVTLTGGGVANFGNSDASIQTINYNGNNSTFSGTANVLAGDTLSLNHNNSYFNNATANATVNVDNGATLVFNGASDGTTTAIITGSGKVDVKTGLVIDSSNSDGANKLYTGTINVEGGKTLSLLGEFDAGTINMGTGELRIEAAQTNMTATLNGTNSLYIGDQTAPISDNITVNMNGNLSGFTGVVKFANSANLAMTNATASNAINASSIQMADMAGVYTTGTNILELGVTDGVFKAAISGDAADTIHVTANAELTGSNTAFKGDVTFANAADLKLNNVDAFGAANILMGGDAGANLLTFAQGMTTGAKITGGDNDEIAIGGTTAADPANITVTLTGDNSAFGGTIKFNKGGDLRLWATDAAYATGAKAIDMATDTEVNELTLEVEGPANAAATYGAVITSGSNDIIYVKANTTLTGDNTGFAGNVTVSGDKTLTLKSNIGSDTASGTLTLGANSILNLEAATGGKNSMTIVSTGTNGRINVNEAYTLDGTNSGFTGTVYVENNSALTLQSTATKNAFFNNASTVIDTNGIGDTSAGVVNFQGTASTLVSLAGNGTVNVQKLGTDNSVLTLSGNNTAFAGTANIEAAQGLVLTTQFGGTTADGTTITLDAGSKLTFNGAATGTVNYSTISSNGTTEGTIEVLANTELFGNNSAFNGDVSIVPNAILTLSGTNSVFSADATINVGYISDTTKATLKFNAGLGGMSDVTVAAILTGNGAIDVAKSVNLTADNSGFTGTTTVQQGQQLTLSNAFNASAIDLIKADATVGSSLVLNSADTTFVAVISGSVYDSIFVKENAVLDAAGTAAALNDYAGLIVLADGTTLTLKDANTTAAIFSTLLTDTAKIDLDAATVLTGADALNGFKGTVELDVNALTIQQAVNSAAVFTGTATSSITLNGAANTLSGTAAIDSFAGTLALGANAVSFTNAVDSAAIFTGTAASNITLNGADNTFSGTTAINAFDGTIALDDNNLTLTNAVDSLARFTSAATGGTLTFSDETNVLKGVDAINGFHGTVALDDNNVSFTYGVNTDSVFTGIAGSVIDLNGASNTFSGTAAINGFAGEIQLENNTLSLTNAVDSAATFTSGTSGVLDLNGATNTLSAVGAINGFAGIVALEGNDVTFTNTVASAAKFTGTTDADIIFKSAGNNLTVAGALNDFGGTVDLTDGDLKLSANNTTSADFTGDETLTIAKDTVQVFNANGAISAYTGTVSFEAGSSSLSPATLTLNGENTTTAEFNSNGDINALVNVNADNTFSSAGALKDYSGKLRLKGDLTLGGDNTTSAIFDAATDATSGDLNLADSTTLTLNALNALAAAYAGTINFGNAATLTLNNDNTTAAVMNGDNSAIINLNGASTVLTAAGAIDSFAGIINLDDNALTLSEAASTGARFMTTNALAKVIASKGITLTAAAGQTYDKADFAGILETAEGYDIVVDRVFDAGQIILGPDNATVATNLQLKVGGVYNAAITGDSNDTIFVYADTTLAGNNTNFNGVIDLATNNGDVAKKVVITSANNAYDIILGTSTAAQTVEFANDTATTYVARIVGDGNDEILISKSATFDVADVRTGKSTLGDFAGTVRIAGNASATFNDVTVTDAKFADGSGTWLEPRNVYFNENTTLNALNSINASNATFTIADNKSLTINGVNSYSGAVFAGSALSAINLNANLVLHKGGVVNAFAGKMTIADGVTFTLQDNNSSAMILNGNGTFRLGNTAAGGAPTITLTAAQALGQDFTGTVEFATGKGGTLNINGVNNSAAKFVSTAADPANINVNADVSMTTAAALDAFHGTANIAADKTLTLTKANSTDMALTGAGTILADDGAATALTVTLSGDVSAFAGTFEAAQNDTLVLSGTVGTDVKVGNVGTIDITGTTTALTVTSDAAATNVVLNDRNATLDGTTSAFGTVSVGTGTITLANTFSGTVDVLTGTTGKESKLDLTTFAGGTISGAVTKFKNIDLVAGATVPGGSNDSTVTVDGAITDNAMISLALGSVALGGDALLVGTNAGNNFDNTNVTVTANIAAFGSTGADTFSAYKLVTSENIGTFNGNKLYLSVDLGVPVTVELEIKDKGSLFDGSGSFTISGSTIVEVDGKLYVFNAYTDTTDKSLYVNAREISDATEIVINADWKANAIGDIVVWPEKANGRFYVVGTSAFGDFAGVPEALRAKKGTELGMASKISIVAPFKSATDVTLYYTADTNALMMGGRTNAAGDITDVTNLILEAEKNPRNVVGADGGVIDAFVIATDGIYASQNIAGKATQLAINNVNITGDVYGGSKTGDAVFSSLAINNDYSTETGKTMETIRGNVIGGTDKASANAGASLLTITGGNFVAGYIVGGNYAKDGDITSMGGSVLIANENNVVISGRIAGSLAEGTSSITTGRSMITVDLTGSGKVTIANDIYAGGINGGTGTINVDSSEVVFRGDASKLSFSGIVNGGVLGNGTVTTKVLTFENFSNATGANAFRGVIQNMDTINFVGDTQVQFRSRMNLSTADVNFTITGATNLNTAMLTVANAAGWVFGANKDITITVDTTAVQNGKYILVDGYDALTYGNITLKDLNGNILTTGYTVGKDGGDLTLTVNTTVTADKTIYVDFNGGSMTYDNINVAAYDGRTINLSASGVDAAAIVGKLNATAQGVTYVVGGGTYADSDAVIYVGGTGDLASAGALKGVSEPMAAGADAVVNTFSISNEADLVATIAHEAGHLTGDIAIHGAADSIFSYASSTEMLFGDEDTTVYDGSAGGELWNSCRLGEDLPIGDAAFADSSLNLGLTADDIESVVDATLFTSVASDLPSIEDPFKTQSSLEVSTLTTEADLTKKSSGILATK